MVSWYWASWPRIENRRPPRRARPGAGRLGTEGLGEDALQVLLVEAGLGAIFLAPRGIAEVAIERPLRRHLVARGIDLAAVIARALVLVGQDIVGGADLLEPVRRLGLAGIDVGVVALGELAVGGTDRRLAVGLLHAEVS